MPIKNNSNRTFITKKIYINWCEQEVLTEEEYEKHLNEIMREMLEDENVLGEWLCDNLYYHQIGRMVMDEKYRAEKMAEFEEYCRDRIKDEDDEWQEVEVTF